MPLRFRRIFLLAVVLSTALRSAPLLAAATNTPVLPPTSQFVLTSVFVEGTNLTLSAAIPSGVEQVILEMRPAPGAQWEELGLLAVPAGGGDVAFTIPKPADAVEFFRLKAKPRLESAPVVSGELEYVTLPSLGSNVTDTGEAVFHFKGMVDGSDKILITRHGAFWTHVNWDWPQKPVTINGTQWNPREKNYLTTVGAAKFLPEPFSLESANLEVIQGRDIIALERTNDALIVYLDDTPSNAGEYEFKIHFHRPAPKPAGAVASVPARLKIAAQIDGSDCIKFTDSEATWEHKAWSRPAQVTLNGIAWSQKRTNVLKNAGTNLFLPPGIDFSSARIIGRKGRDVATLWSDKNAMWVWFADNPNGRDSYELEISFGR